jgi:hypothetical protein
LFIRLRWGEWNNFLFFLLFFLLDERFWFGVIFIESWWVVNETSRFLNPSINSNCVLLVLSLFEIFILSSSNISIAGSFPNSLNTNSFNDFFQGISFLFIRLRWGEWDSFTTFFLFFFFLGEDTVFLDSWWVVNETSGFLNPSGNSNFVLLIFRLLIIFLLSSSNISITGGFPSSLDTNSFNDFS